MTKIATTNFLLMKLWKFSLSNLNIFTFQFDESVTKFYVLRSKYFIDFDEIFVDFGQIS